MALYKFKMNHSHSASNSPALTGGGSGGGGGGGRGVVYPSIGHPYPFLTLSLFRTGFPLKSRAGFLCLFLLSCILSVYLADAFEVDGVVFKFRY